MIPDYRLSLPWSMSMVMARMVNTHQGCGDAIGVPSIAPVGLVPAIGCATVRGNVMSVRKPTGRVRDLEAAQVRVIYATIAVVSAGTLSTVLAATGDLPPEWHRLTLAVTIVFGVAAVVVTCTYATAVITRTATKAITRRLEHLEEEQRDREERIVNDAVSKSLDAWELHRTRSDMRGDH